MKKAKNKTNYGMYILLGMVVAAGSWWVFSNYNLLRGKMQQPEVSWASEYPTRAAEVRQAAEAYMERVMVAPLPESESAQHVGTHEEGAVNEDTHTHQETGTNTTESGEHEKELLMGYRAPTDNPAAFIGVTSKPNSYAIGTISFSTNPNTGEENSLAGAEVNIQYDNHLQHTVLLLSQTGNGWVVDGAMVHGDH